MKEVLNKRKSERGGAGIKLLLAMVLIILLANAGYHYVPVAYQGASFKQEMEAAVVQGTLVPMPKTSPMDAVRYKLMQAAKTSSIPDNAFIEVKQVGNMIQGRVYYTKNVEILPFGLYNYNYTFDYTAVPAGYIAKN
ncbi:MAG: hypothetical protein R2747_20320 [Pyrinomonadaceae bacterium]